LSKKKKKAPGGGGIDLHRRKKKRATPYSPRETPRRKTNLRADGMYWKKRTTKTNTGAILRRNDARNKPCPSVGKRTAQVMARGGEQKENGTQGCDEEAV